MKQLLYFLCTIVLITCAYSCSQATKKEDKSERFIGTWIDIRTLKHGIPTSIRIERSEDKFLIYPTEFYMWDGITGLTGKTLSANYDVQNDKLIVSLSSRTEELIYNPNDSSLICGSNKLIRQIK